MVGVLESDSGIATSGCRPFAPYLHLSCHGLRRNRFFGRARPLFRFHVTIQVVENQRCSWSSYPFVFRAGEISPLKFKWNAGRRLRMGKSHPASGFADAHGSETIWNLR